MSLKSCSLVTMKKEDVVKQCMKKIDYIQKENEERYQRELQRLTKRRNEWRKKFWLRPLTIDEVEKSNYSFYPNFASNSLEVARRLLRACRNDDVDEVYVGIEDFDLLWD